MSALSVVGLRAQAIIDIQEYQYAIEGAFVECLERMTISTAKALALIGDHLASFKNKCIDRLSIAKPPSVEEAIDWSKIVSKLSPVVGNLLELETVLALNKMPEFRGLGKWKRQDPDFPDVLFEGDISPAPGVEIKAWFPLATEITGRFKDSQNAFKNNQTYVALAAWLPSELLHGMPTVLDVCFVSALSIAKARDAHYHNPPDYLVIEPNDTSARTRNLQQTNTNGYKWQGSDAEFREAEKLVASWGRKGKTYEPTAEYQEKIRTLQAQFKYRLDTNFAKMDRIVHPEIEAFKESVLARKLNGYSVAEWAGMLYGRKAVEVEKALGICLGLTTTSSTSRSSRA